MSLRETRTFLEELILRFDPELDVTEGSRADVDLIQPILGRIGLDPLDEDMHVFVRERVRQAMGSRMAINEIDELTDVLIDPCRVLFEPLSREVKLVRLRSSLQNSESLADAEVDSLMGNFFESRISGGYAVGVVRAYYASPQTVSVTSTSIAVTRSGLRFLPTRSQGLTRDQMRSNVDGSEYYFDINYIAEAKGDEYNIEQAEISSVANLTSATRVTNLRRFRDGTPREGGVEFISRVQRGAGDRALVNEPGIISSIESAYPAVRGILVVGFGDPEMQRDIIKGGGLGTVPDADDLGAFYGVGTPVDDADADTTSPWLSAPGAGFVSRVGSVGPVPSGWVVTLTYVAGGVPVATDAAILAVRSDTEAVLDHEIPLAATSIVWMLRRRELTISDIPGGITLPDTTDGDLELRSDEIHIGGKTDVYIGGSADVRTATINVLSDEDPLARGQNAQTQAATAGEESVVLLNDLSVDLALIRPEMSLVLGEGVDAGSYRITEVLSSPDRVRLDTDMTGTQDSLAWRIVNDIDVELTDPKNIKALGADMVTAAGNPNVITTSAFNFLDAGVAEDDILEIIGAGDGGGEFNVIEVSATTLKVNPAPPRTLGTASWRVFTRSEGVLAPVVRVRSLELLDSTGAPNGTTIPLRDPVLVHSRAFQNEGEGYVRDGLVLSGIVSPKYDPSASLDVGAKSMIWRTMDVDRVWGVVAGGDAGTFTFSGGNKTVAAMVAEINADTGLSAKGIKAVGIVDGVSVRLGLLCSRFLKLTGGTLTSSPPILGEPVLFPQDITNATLRSYEGSAKFPAKGVRVGDLVEFVGGPNAGRTARLARRPDESLTGSPALLTTGPGGPSTNPDALYDAAILAPAAERGRIGHASVGSARAYFLDPTSIEFPYQTSRFSLNGLTYRPDPENRRQILPAVPTTAPARGASTTTTTLTDTERDFLLLSIKPGDLVQLLYAPIIGTGALVSPANVAVGGLYLRLSVAEAPYVTISFPFDMPRQDVVDYINTQSGVDIASLNAGVLEILGDDSVTIDPTSTVITDGGDPLFLGTLLSTDLTTVVPSTDTVLIVAAVSENTLTLSPATEAPSSGAAISYRIDRYTQRISSTEMNDQIDGSGLYYADVQLQSEGPGDQYNVDAELPMGLEGHAGDGYRLSTEEDITSYSRAELLYAEISRTILLVGSSDSPEEAVQLSQNNVLVTYDRSQLVDDIQSFMDAGAKRPVCSEPLVRHLFPHYVSLTWNYVGGQAEAATTRAVLEAIDDPNYVVDGLEVGDLIKAAQSKGATSVYVTDAGSPTGRGAPVMVVVYHDAQRAVRARIVKDIVDTVRTQKFFAGDVVLRRTSVGGIR